VLGPAAAPPVVAVLLLLQVPKKLSYKESEALTFTLSQVQNIFLVAKCFCVSINKFFSVYTKTNIYIIKI